MFGVTEKESVGEEGGEGKGLDEGVKGTVGRRDL